MIISSAALFCAGLACGWLMRGDGGGTGETPVPPDKTIDSRPAPIAQDVSSPDEGSAAEEGTAFGYADAIIETKKFVWVFEFKFNKSAKAAIRQIRENGYAAAYKGDKRPVTLVGVNFRAAKRNIDEPLFAAL